jgi:hypothetical protein
MYVRVESTAYSLGGHHATYVAEHAYSFPGGGVTE